MSVQQMEEPESERFHIQLQEGFKKLCANPESEKTKSTISWQRLLWLPL